MITAKLAREAQAGKRMNIGIVGGGPAGLFFAYLMKRHDPGHAHPHRRARSGGRDVRLGRGVLRHRARVRARRRARALRGDDARAGGARRDAHRPSRRSGARSPTTRSTGCRASTCCARCASTARRSASRSSSAAGRRRRRSSPTATSSSRPTARRARSARGYRRAVRADARRAAEPPRLVRHDGAVRSAVAHLPAERATAC